jgi:membrane fusion protein, multidrug efflux system
MRQSRLSALLLGLLAVAIAAGVAYWFSSASTERAGIGAKKASRSPHAAARHPVVTQLATVEDFPVRRRTIGTLESPASVIIRSRIDSQVLEQHVTDGDIVKKDDLLFTLDDREIRATIARDEATIAKDQAALTQAEAALRRTQELISKNVAPQQQLEQATAAYKAAQQTVEADEAVLQADRLRLGYAELKAPITGRIGAIRVAPGNLVSANDTAGLVTLTQMQPLRVSFTLPERDLAALREAAQRTPPATVRVYTSGEPEPLSSGTLDFVDSSVDSSSGTIAAKATFPNETYKLWPGQYVDVEIDLATWPNTITVPTVAIQSGQSGPYVFVAKADQGAGERIVVEGQLRLTPGTRWHEAEQVPGANQVSSSDTNKSTAAIKTPKP